MDIKWKIGFGLIIGASIVLFIVTLYDIFSLQQRYNYLFYASIILMVFSIILLLLMYRSSRKQMDQVAIFEKTLQGGLYHYKCPHCNGLFALKESKENEIYSLILTCPDCGSLGRISHHPPKIIERIPSQKSPRIAFICNQCGERINIWSEGSSLSENISIFSCPYCGYNKPMKHQR